MPARTPAAVLSLLLAVGAAAAPAAAAPAPPAWEHPGYDAGDSYHNPHESAITATSIGRLVRKWSVRLRPATAETCSKPSAPVLRDGTAFVTDHRGVAAYAAGTGKAVWDFDWDEPSENFAPRLALSDHLLVGVSTDCQSTSNPHGRVTVWADGKLRWTLPLDGVDQAVVDRGVVVIAQHDAASGFADISAYRVFDGRRLWYRERAGTAGVSAGGTLLVFQLGPDDTPSGESSAVDVETGRTLWTRKQTWYVQAAGPAADRFYAVDGTGALAAVARADGRVVWRTPIEAGADVRSGWRDDLLAADRDRVYRAHDRTVEALDAATGRRLWSTRLPAGARQPVVAGGLVYTGGAVLKAADGEPVGRSLAGAVVVTGGRLYQVDRDVLTAYAPA